MRTRHLKLFMQKIAPNIRPFVTIVMMLTIALVATVSCVTDISKNPSATTDFIPGQVYELKQSVYLVRGSLMQLKKRSADSEGELNSGTRLIVRKIEKLKEPELGTVTDVFAEVLSGKLRGRIVNLITISESSRAGYTKRKPDMLELVKESSNQ